MTPNEELFWTRVRRLKKMVKKISHKKDPAYKAMWKRKLVELMRKIG